MKDLKELFLDELKDIYDAEKRLTKALPKMAKAATNTKLQKAFEDHLKQTEGQIEKLEKVFAAFDEKPKAKTCKAMQGLTEEGDEIIKDFKGEPALNAALISAAQKVEHYEIASYGCLHEWASSLGNPTAAKLLKQILDEESATDEKLTKLAVDTINKEAMDAGTKE